MEQRPIIIKQNNGGWWAALILAITTTPLGCLIVPVLLVGLWLAFTVGAGFWPLLVACLASAAIGRARMPLPAKAALIFAVMLTGLIVNAFHYRAMYPEQFPAHGQALRGRNP